MSRYFHIPIFQQTYILTLAVYKTTVNFNKEHKYTLGCELKNVCHKLLRLIVLVNSSGRKTEQLKDLSQELENLRIYLRLAYDLKLLGPGIFGKINEQIEAIGKQIGGWQKWANRK
ncbi:four helix bundle protein [Patescibacteria group bacterium]|nr:four helix bundle protein [Patescibacteria group bacterium]MCG2690104.1 four helix bundle protein [Candidatus Parcubacteria bacterium]